MVTSMLLTTRFLALVLIVERRHRQPGRARWIDRDVVGNAAAADREWTRLLR